MSANALSCSRAFALGLTLLAGATFAHAQSTTGMDPSAKISVGAVSILVSPAASAGGSSNETPEFGSLLAAGGASFVVTGITQVSADTTEIIIESAGGAAKASVRLSTSAVRNTGLSLGSAVEAVASSTGTALVVSGKVLAFIPTKLGEALLHHEKVPG